MMLALRCVLLLLLVPQCLALFSMKPQDGQKFLQDILKFYGQNRSISTENLEQLLLLISARRPQTITENNPLSDQEVSDHLLISYRSCRAAIHSDYY